MTGRIAKILMCLALGIFLAIIAYDNAVDYTANYVFVQHVLSMDTLPAENPLRGRALTSPTLWAVAYGAIIVTEAIIGMLYIAAAYALWSSRSADARTFHAAKRWTYAATLGGFALYFVGFEIVGGEYFAMWQSARWNGQPAAFRIYMTMLAVLIFVNQPDAELANRRAAEEA